MPVSEADVGITELLGSHRPFRGVLKQTLHDFVVKEVSSNGEVVTIKRPARLPPPPSAPAKREAQEGAPPGPRAEPSFDALDALFPTSPEPPSSGIRAALDAKQPEFVLPAVTDKTTRTAIHAWVRENLPTHVSDTVDTPAGQAVRVRPRATCRPWKRRRGRDGSARDAKNEWTYDPRENHRGRGNGKPRVDPHAYVSFVLWKRNTDTMEALNTLSRVLRVPTGAFSYAGTKDKRAVTTQRVHIRGVSEERFARANDTLTRRGVVRRGREAMLVGDVEVLPKGAPVLRLGDLKGNRFSIALRDLEVNSEADEENVRAAVESVRERGFVNYYGLQRFGSGVSGTHETGFAFLRKDFREVCRRILLPLVLEEWQTNGEGVRPERKQAMDALQKFQERKIKAQELSQVLPKWMHLERALVASFCHDESRGVEKYDYRAAFEKLPRNMRRMYGHAVQSYLWNVMASARIQMYRPDHPSRMHAIKGDLVRVTEECTQELNYDTPVRAVTAEEESGQSISVFKVLIPVIGSEVEIPNVQYGDAVKEILGREKVSLQDGLSSEYGMKGTYRCLLAKPGEVECDIVAYSNSSDVLVPSSRMPNINRDIKDSSKKCEREQDVQAGNSKKGELDSYPVPKKEDGLDNVIEEQHGINSANGKASTPDKLPQNNARAGNKKALVISFTLGCGQYATMFVRELTRKDSATSNQKAMQTSILRTATEGEASVKSPEAATLSLAEVQDAVPS